MTMTDSTKKYEIIIQADVNDGDYVTAINEISEADLYVIRPLIAAIAVFKPYKAVAPEGSLSQAWTHRRNYPAGERGPREDLGEMHPQGIYPEIPAEIFDIFEEFVPWGEHGIHSITGVTVSPLVEREVLL